MRVLSEQQRVGLSDLHCEAVLAFSCLTRLSRLALVALGFVVERRHLDQRLSVVGVLVSVGVFLVDLGRWLHRF